MAWTADAFVLLAVHALLLVVLLWSFWATWRESGKIKLTVTRGGESMNALYVMYGVATVVYALVVQVADAFEGFKVLFIVADYLVLTYLFFFSSRFRNLVVFRTLNRIKED
jgi:hypothetical protein